MKTGANVAAGIAESAGDDALYRAAREAAGDPQAALVLAGRFADALPLPGAGSTAQLWEGLARLGMIDLTVARAIEPHLDARAILAEAGDDPVNHAKIGTKLVIMIAVLACAEIGNAKAKRGEAAATKLAWAAAGLALVNAAIAFLW